MRPTPTFSPADIQKAKLTALIEEYRAMYALVLFRLAALDRRIPVAGATLAAFVGTVTALPLASREVVLVGIPVAAVWLLRVTVNHARSFEDALRRIESVEQRVNTLLESEVVGFQSRHPSRRRSVGGRTGQESIRAVLAAGILMLAGCAYLFAADHDREAAQLYLAYVGLISVYMLAFARRLLHYRYEPGTDLLTG